MSNIAELQLKGIVAAQQQPQQAEQKTPLAEQGLFTEMLAEAELADLHFSNHAMQRMERRSIRLSSDELALLSDGVTKAQQKGAKEALLLMEQQKAFVVNVPGRTVITVMDQEGMKEKLFTNIDSAILLSRK